LLQRIGELELDLSQTYAANSRLAADVTSLRKVHRELVDAYDRMKAQHREAKKALAEERQRYSRLEQDFSAQLNEWHDKMLHKAKELEELQQLPDPTREIEMIRLKVSEELEGPYLEKLEQYEKRGELETRKLNDAKRQIEVLRLELSQKNKDLLTFEQDAQGRLHAQRKVYQTKLDSLQSDLEKNTQLAGTTTTLRQQVYERASKNKSLLEEMEEMEARHRTELEQLRRDLDSQTAFARDLEKSKRELQSDVEAVKREKEELGVRNLSYISEVDGARESLLRLQHLQDTESERERSRAELVGKLKRAEGEAELKGKEIEVKDGEIRRLKERCEQLLKDATEASADADQRVSDAELQVTAEKEATTHALSSLKAEVEHLRTQLRDKESTFTKELAEYEKKLESLTTESQQLRITADTEERRARENDRRAREYDSLNGQHQDLERQHKNLTADFASLKTNHEGTTAENRKLVEKLEEVNRLQAENRRRLESESEKQLGSIKATLEQAERQISEKEKLLSKVKGESKQIASASKKKIESQKAKTKQLLDRYTSMVTEKEHAIRIAETNKKKYELQMLQVHKLLNDPALKEQLQPSFDADVGFFKELQSLRDCLDEAIYVVAPSSKGGAASGLGGVGGGPSASTVKSPGERGLGGTTGR